VPGVDREDFDKALREDRLTIAPVDVPSLPHGAQLLSLSPDGQKLLVLAGEQLSVYTFADGVLLPLMPNVGKSSLSDEAMRHLLARPEANAVSWSADGRYLSLSFPGRFFAHFVMNGNVWIADLETGVISPRFELPEGTRLPKVGVPYTDRPDIPVRATFDTEQPILYYDLLKFDTVDGSDVYAYCYYQWDYEADEVAKIGEIAGPLQSVDANLRKMGEYFVTVVSYPVVLDMGSGLAAMSGGMEPKLSLESEGILKAMLRYAHLIDAHDTAILFTSQIFGNLEFLKTNAQIMGDELELEYGMIARLHLIECSLDQNGEAQYEGFLALDVSAPPELRMLRISVEEVNDEKMMGALSQRLLWGEIAYLFNAAFSPDGAYLLLAASAYDETKSLYVLNRATGECGLIALPQEFQPAKRAFAYDDRGLRFSTRGIQWSEGGRLLLSDGTANRLYELAVQK